MVSLFWNLVLTLTHKISETNSNFHVKLSTTGKSLMFTFFRFWPQITYLGKFGPKSQNSQLKLKMQNSIMVTFFDLKLENHCWVNLVQKIKIVRLSWNLVPRLIWICRRCGSFYLYYDWKYPFRANLVHKIEFVLLSWNLVPRLIRICRIQWYGSFNLF